MNKAHISHKPKKISFYKNVVPKFYLQCCNDCIESPTIMLDDHSRTRKKTGSPPIADIPCFKPHTDIYSCTWLIIHLPFFCLPIVPPSVCSRSLCAFIRRSIYESINGYSPATAADTPGGRSHPILEAALV